MADQGSSPISVVIADANREEMDRCRALLGGDSGVDVVAQAARWEEALACVRHFQPRVLLFQWNLGLWARGAEDWLADFRAACPSMRILVLAAPADRSAAQWAMIHGVRGVISPEALPGELLQAVYKVARNDEAWISRRDLKGVLTQCSHFLAARPRGYSQ